MPRLKLATPRTGKQAGGFSPLLLSFLRLGSCQWKWVVADAAAAFAGPSWKQLGLPTPCKFTKSRLPETKITNGWNQPGLLTRCMVLANPPNPGSMARWKGDLDKPTKPRLLYMTTLGRCSVHLTWQPRSRWGHSRGSERSTAPIRKGPAQSRGGSRCRLSRWATHNLWSHGGEREREKFRNFRVTTHFWST